MHLRDRNAYKMFFRKPEEKKPYGIPSVNGRIILG
jgi:hypothetical protein